MDVNTNRRLLITQRIGARRAELGLTQKQIVTRLARCGVCTTNRALSSLEHGAGLDVARLPELAIALDCTVTYLVGLTDDPHRWEPDGDHGGPTRAPAPHRSAAPPDAGAASSLILGAEIPERSPSRW